MAMPPTVPAISAKELKQRRDGKLPHLLVDVREPSEHAHCSIDGAKLIPLAELPGRLHQLPKDQEIIVHCHHGGRSAQAVRFLIESGFAAAKNLSGGIDAWSADVDPSVPRY